MERQKEDGSEVSLSCVIGRGREGGGEGEKEKGDAGEREGKRERGRARNGERKRGKENEKKRARDQERERRERAGGGGQGERQAEKKVEEPFMMQQVSFSSVLCFLLPPACHRLFPVRIRAAIIGQISCYVSLETWGSG
jgi:hypothetical protein